MVTSTYLEMDTSCNHLDITHVHERAYLFPVSAQ